MRLTLSVLVRPMATVFFATMVCSFGCQPPEPESEPTIYRGGSRPQNTTVTDRNSRKQSAAGPTSRQPAVGDDSLSDGPKLATSDRADSPDGSGKSEKDRPRPKPQPGKTIDLTFDDLKFDIEKDGDFHREMLPQGIEDLDGQSIRIGGFMLPSFQQRDIKQFVLVRDNMECCFGPGAALYDCILIEMETSGVDFTVRPVTVEGKFTIQEYKSPDGDHLAIYHISGKGVR